MRLRGFYVLLALSVVLAACAPAATPVPTAAPTQPPVVNTAPPSPANTLDGRCGDKSLLAKELQLYTWVEYIDPAIKEQFEAECGVKIVETNYDTNETLLATLQAGSTGWDIVVPADYMVQTLIKEGMLQQLDYNNIPNIKHIVRPHVYTYFDPQRKYTVPYFWGTSGLAVDTSVIPEPEASWKMVFEPSREICGRISMLDDQRETIGAALMYLGYSINATNPAHLEEAKQLLIEQARCVRAYDSQSHDEMLIRGETVIGHMWTGDGILAGDAAAGGREEIIYVIPKEGCTIWQDNMTVPVGAPNKYTAEVFMNYLHDPEINAQNTTYVGYATTNSAAKSLIDPEARTNTAVYPDSATMASLQWIGDVGGALEVYDRIWTEFKAAAGARN